MICDILSQSNSFLECPNFGSRNSTPGSFTLYTLSPLAPTQPAHARTHTHTHIHTYKLACHTPNAQKKALPPSSCRGLGLALHPRRLESHVPQPWIAGMPRTDTWPWDPKAEQYLNCSSRSPRSKNERESSIHTYVRTYMHAGIQRYRHRWMDG